MTAGVGIRVVLSLLPITVAYSAVWCAERGPLNLGAVLAATVATATVVAMARLGRRPSGLSNGRQS